MTAKKKGNARQNGHVQVVSIRFAEDGRERHLRLDFNALEVLEDHGVNVLEEGALAQNMTIKKIKVILYALLKHEDPDLTLAQVGSWISPNNMAESIEKLDAALRAGTQVPKASG